jgi:hypothetical protein
MAINLSQTATFALYAIFLIGQSVQVYGVGNPYYTNKDYCQTLNSPSNSSYISVMMNDLSNYQNVNQTTCVQWFYVSLYPSPTQNVLVEVYITGNQGPHTPIVVGIPMEQGFPQLMYDANGMLSFGSLNPTIAYLDFYNNASSHFLVFSSDTESQNPIGNSGGLYIGVYQYSNTTQGYTVSNLQYRVLVSNSSMVSNLSNSSCPDSCGLGYGLCLSNATCSCPLYSGQEYYLDTYCAVAAYNAIWEESQIYTIYPANEVIAAVDDPSNDPILLTTSTLNAGINMTVTIKPTIIFPSGNILPPSIPAPKTFFINGTSSTIYYPIDLILNRGDPYSSSPGQCVWDVVIYATTYDEMYTVNFTLTTNNTGFACAGPSGLTSYAIAGIVIGCVVAGMLILAFTVWRCKKARASKNSQDKSNNKPLPARINSDVEEVPLKNQTSPKSPNMNVVGGGFQFPPAEEIDKTPKNEP